MLHFRFPVPRQVRSGIASIRGVPIVVTLAVIIASTCASSTIAWSAPKQAVFPVRVTVVAFDTRCELDRDEVPPGLVELVLENHAAHTRAVQLVRSDATNESRFAGGVAGLQPGASQAVVVSVASGLLSVSCTSAQAGTELAHFTIAVTGASDSAIHVTANSDSEGTIELGRDCRYDLMSPVRRESTWVIRNASPAVQDLRVLSVPAGVTPSEIARVFAETGSVPEEMEAGGMGLLSPGEEASLRVGLAPGEYLAWCSIYVDQKNGYKETNIDLSPDEVSAGDDSSEQPFTANESPGWPDLGDELALLPSTTDPHFGADDEMLALPGVGDALQPFSVIESD
jgi:hypothetical protein